MKFNDKHKQAQTYHDLGVIALKRQQWQPAKDNLLQSLSVYAKLDDTNHIIVVLRSLSKLRKASADDTIPATIAEILGTSIDEVVQKLSKVEQTVLHKKIDKFISIFQKVRPFSFVIGGLLGCYIGYIYWGVMGGILGVLLGLTVGSFLIFVVFMAIFLAMLFVFLTSWWLYHKKIKRRWT